MKTSNKIFLSFLGFFILMAIGLVVAAKQSLIKKGDTIEGNGEMITEVREVEDFTQIDLRVPFEVIVSQGPKKLVVEAESNLMPLIYTGVRGDEFDIDEPEDKILKPTKKVVIRVSAPYIDKIEDNASGQISSEGVLKADDFQLEGNGASQINLALETNYLNVSSNGVGSVTLEGRADEMQININGTSMVNLKKVQAKTANVQINGTGTIDLGVLEKLNGNINGTGNVYYRGNPKAWYNSNGPGRFIHVEEETVPEPTPVDSSQVMETAVDSIDLDS